MHHRINKVARLAPNRGIDQHKSGQRQGIVKEDGIADTSGNRRQVKLYRHQHDQHHPPPEDRHGIAGQREAYGGVVEDRAAFDRRQHSHRDPDDDGKNHRADAQLHGGLKARHEPFPDGNTAIIITGSPGII